MRKRQWRLQARTWRVPCIYAGSAIAAGIFLPRLETRFLGHWVSDVNISAAMAMYSAIASGMITLTGIVFSLTFVMVQFSATAYSPRLVLWVARDPLISHALGIFMATFLYAVAALAWLGRSDVGVPFVSALAVVGLLLASVAFFIALVQRIAALQVSRLLTFTGDRGREVIDALYPSLDLTINTVGPVVSKAVRQASFQICAHRGRPLAVQRIDTDALRYLAQRVGGVMEVAVAVGDTVMEGTPLLHVYGARAFLDERSLRDAFDLGEERTFEQDPKYALRLLVDIAVKALSPAINDPTTAVQALDQIGDLLLRLSRRRLEIGTLCDQEGKTRVVVPYPSWDDFLCLAFDEIHYYGATSVQVMRRMNALIVDLLYLAPIERRDGLRSWQRSLDASIQRTFPDAEERQRASVADRQGLGISRRQSAA